MNENSNMLSHMPRRILKVETPDNVEESQDALCKGRYLQPTESWKRNLSEDNHSKSKLPTSSYLKDIKSSNLNGGKREPLKNLENKIVGSSSKVSKLPSKSQTTSRKPSKHSPKSKIITKSSYALSNISSKIDKASKVLIHTSPKTKKTFTDQNINKSNKTPVIQHTTPSNVININTTITHSNDANIDPVNTQKDHNGSRLSLTPTPKSLLTPNKTPLGPPIRYTSGGKISTSSSHARSVNLAMKLEMDHSQNNATHLDYYNTNELLNENPTITGQNYVEGQVVNKESEIHDYDIDDNEDNVSDDEEEDDNLFHHSFHSYKSDSIQNTSRHRYDIDTTDQIDDDLDMDEDMDMDIQQQEQEQGSNEGDMTEESNNSNNISIYKPSDSYYEQNNIIHQSIQSILLGTTLSSSTLPMREQSTLNIPEVICNQGMNNYDGNDEDIENRHSIHELPSIDTISLNSTLNSLLNRAMIVNTSKDTLDDTISLNSPLFHEEYSVHSVRSGETKRENNLTRMMNMTSHINDSNKENENTVLDVKKTPITDIISTNTIIKVQPAFNAEKMVAHNIDTIDTKINQFFSTPIPNRTRSLLHSTPLTGVLYTPPRLPIETILNASFSFTLEESDTDISNASPTRNLHKTSTDNSKDVQKTPISVKKNTIIESNDLSIHDIDSGNNSDNFILPEDTLDDSNISISTPLRVPTCSEPYTHHGNRKVSVTSPTLPMSFVQQVMSTPKRNSSPYNHHLLKSATMSPCMSYSSSASIEREVFLDRSAWKAPMFPTPPPIRHVHVLSADTEFMDTHIDHTPTRPSMVECVQRSQQNESNTVFNQMPVRNIFSDGSLMSVDQSTSILRKGATSHMNIHMYEPKAINYRANNTTTTTTTTTTTSNDNRQHNTVNTMRSSMNTKPIVTEPMKKVTSIYHPGTGSTERHEDPVARQLLMLNDSDLV